ncbi:DUF523 domain-containing protein [Sulfurospirillum diekertiae]|uniref:Uncharacterized protein n=1 Tax=Sulfurospirillum diekertiae TaxID=1854492 RepID=A0A1Y0HND0_9BACT|nr:DUF523 domain-containing protein [Sulfurospirillum diekertiae]ARU49612.1 hypothetical protein Sdiek1_2462 [Sulfurospirillum diekertiae]ASC94413.1 hypothetical protein Sdiek2_2407 [Sulfurospirillum diekertiae]
MNRERKILISACLMGENVKYDGGNNALHVKMLEAWKEQGVLVPLCPEVLGGLSVPRPPCEVLEGTNTVVCKSGEDVSEAFAKGARESLKIAQEEGVCMAILKARSPSCGKDVIYDGTFTSTRVNDSGITCKLLRENGIAVFSEEELALAEAFWRQKG